MAYLSNVKVKGSIILTRDYSTGLLVRRSLKAGTTVIIVDVHQGFLRGVTHLSVRHPKTGQFFREVPADYFLA